LVKVLLSSLVKVLSKLILPVLGPGLESFGKVFGLEFHGSNQGGKRNLVNIFFDIGEFLKLIFIILKRGILLLESFQGFINGGLP